MFKQSPLNLNLSEHGLGLKFSGSGTDHFEITISAFEEDSQTPIELMRLTPVYNAKGNNYVILNISGIPVLAQVTHLYPGLSNYISGKVLHLVLTNDKGQVPVKLICGFNGLLLTEDEESITVDMVSAVDGVGFTKELIYLDLKEDVIAMNLGGMRLDSNVTWPMTYCIVLQQICEALGLSEDHPLVKKLLQLS